MRVKIRQEVEYRKARIRTGIMKYHKYADNHRNLLHIKLFNTFNQISKQLKNYIIL